MGAPDTEEFERLSSGLQSHGDEHLSGRLPDWHHRACTAVNPFGACKTGDRVDAGPIGVGDALRRFLASAQVEMHNEAIAQDMGLVQVACAVKDGAGILISMVREVIQLKPGFHAVHLDFKNMHNALDREAACQGLAAASRGPRSILQGFFAECRHKGDVCDGHGDPLPFGSSTGGNQGDPRMTVVASHAILPVAKWLDAELRKLGGFVFISDDGHAVGPGPLIYPLIAEFRTVPRSSSIWTVCRPSARRLGPDPRLPEAARRSPSVWFHGQLRGSAPGPHGCGVSRGLQPLRKPPPCRQGGCHCERRLSPLRHAPW